MKQTKHKDACFKMHIQTHNFTSLHTIDTAQTSGLPVQYSALL